MGFRLANVDGRAALVSGDHYFDLEGASGGAVEPDPMAALAVPEQLAQLSETLQAIEPTGTLTGAPLGPPVPRPQKVFGIGLNYGKHAAETSMELPDQPLVFTKYPSCIVGPHSDVELRSDGVDYEGELVVVIGTGGKHIDPSDAWDHVGGLMVGQDISDRPLQKAGKRPQFNLGKSFDTFGPTGPVLVSPDELPDLTAMHITTSVNGEIRQDDTTDNLIFDIPYLVSYLSNVLTLTTGDLIFTGTPDGVGVAQDKLLRDGDEIVTTIDGIGTMVNRCLRLPS